MTSQNQQRAKFEAWVAKHHPAAPLDRSPGQPDDYDGILAAWTWAAWQAAITLPGTPPEPVAGVCSIQPLLPDGRKVTQVTLYQELPAGTQLYTAEALEAIYAQWLRQSSPASLAGSSGLAAAHAAPAGAPASAASRAP